MESAVSKPSIARSERPDRLLVRDLLAGSDAAVGELTSRHWRPIYRAAYLIIGDAQEAEDIAQESILAAIDGLESFDASRPLGPWIRRIAVNQAISASRSQTRLPVPSEEPTSQADPRAATEEVGDADLGDAIRSLPTEQRTVVVMRHLLGFGSGEIAAILGIPRGTVGSRLRRGLDELRASYRRDDG